MSILGKWKREFAVSGSEDEWGNAPLSLSALWCDILARAGESGALEGDAVILVTKKDGATTALNVDRIERVELNNVSQGRESNVFFVGGGHLVVEEAPEVVIEQIVEAKARVVARSFVLSDQERKVPTEPPGPTLRVVPKHGDQE